MEEKLIDVVCVYDSKTEKYGFPIFVDGPVTACRNLALQFAQIPLEFLSDFSIVCIGYYDLSTGCLKSLEGSHFTYVSSENLVDFIKKYFYKKEDDKQ